MDGQLCYVRYDQRDKYEELSKEWEILSQHTLEETLYSKFIQTSVNDYIAITTSNDIKLKGDFVSDFELHKNKSGRVIPLSLQNYFINNIPINETIKNCTNIYDFCLGVKSIGKNRLIAFDKEKQIETSLQKINRYYISNKGIYILKRLPILENKTASMQLDIFGNVDDGTRESRIEANSLQTIFNTYIEKPFNEYDINYQYYIDRCNKIINQIIKI